MRRLSTTNYPRTIQAYKFVSPQSSGEFNSGKSTFINALLGEKYLQDGVVPTTNEITFLRYSDLDSKEQQHCERLPDGQFVCYLPAPILKEMIIVDTPGTNVILQRQQRLTEEFVPRADLLLFVLSADRPLTESEETINYRVGKTDILSDICGVLINVDKKQQQANDIEKLDLYLLDKSGTQFKVSLWGKRSTIFIVDLEVHRQKNVVLIIAGLLVKKKQGNIYLSSTPATSVHFNPKYDDIANFQEYIAQTYGEFICKVPNLIDFDTLTLTINATPCSTLLDMTKTHIWNNQKVLRLKWL